MTSSTVLLCPAASHHMETMSAWSDLAPKCYGLPPPVMPWTHPHTHKHMHISLTHVSCFSCQVTLNKMCHLPDVYVPLSPWGGFSCMIFTWSMLFGLFSYICYFLNIWSIKVKLRLLCLTAHTRPLYSAKLKLNRLSMSRGVTVTAVLRKTDFISCEIKTAGNELQLSGWIAASPGKLGVSANHKIQLSYSYVTQRPLT